jgi:hypothetical protein
MVGHPREKLDFNHLIMDALVVKRPVRCIFQNYENRRGFSFLPFLAGRILKFDPKARNIPQKQKSRHFSVVRETSEI